MRWSQRRLVLSVPLSRLTSLARRGSAWVVGQRERRFGFCALDGLLMGVGSGGGARRVGGSFCWRSDQYRDKIWHQRLFMTESFRVTTFTMPNHALQRTRLGAVVCNPRVPRAGSLSLGR